MKRIRQLALLTLSAAVLAGGCALRPETREDPGLPESAAPAAAVTPRPAEESGSEETEETEETLRALLAGMTTREKVGQLFFIRPDSLDPDQPQAEINGPSSRPVQEVTDEIARMLLAYPVGGVVLFDKNIASPEQLLRFTAALQEASAVPLFIAADEEGGAVSRLGNREDFGLPHWPSVASVGAAGDVRSAEDFGLVIGEYLRRYGLNMDFAPVADVVTDPDNPVIGLRAFSSDPETVALMAGAMARGLRQEGVIPVYKHFPGHGDTRGDSHTGAAVSGKNRSELEACDWVPYLRNDLTGCAVMVGHIALPDLTGTMTPASLSGAVVTDILRGDLGFDGLVITDSLAMAAVAAEHSPGEAAVLAIQAGCDMLLMPNGLGEAFDGVLAAAESGEIARSRLDESVYRILQYKHRLGLL